MLWIFGMRLAVQLFVKFLVITQMRVCFHRIITLLVHESSVFMIHSYFSDALWILVLRCWNISEELCQLSVATQPIRVITNLNQTKPVHKIVEILGNHFLRRFCIEIANCVLEIVHWCPVFSPVKFTREVIFVDGRKSRLFMENVVDCRSVIFLFSLFHTFILKFRLVIDWKNFLKHVYIDDIFYSKRIVRLLCHD